MKKDKKKHHQTSESKDTFFSGAEGAPEKDLADLQHEELSGSDPEEEDLTQTETDEDADEGLGNGKIGKSREDMFDQ